MALKKSSPLNLAALRQDYSMLPRIAAVKAQSSQQFLNAVTSGLEKRKERIEKKELNEAAKKMIEPLLAKPEFQARFGANANADEVLKLIGDPRKAVQLANDVIKSEREFEDRQRRIAREAQVLAKGVYDIKAAERKVQGDKAFSSAIVGLSQDKDYQLTAEQANLMAPNQIQDFLDFKAKQTPDVVKSIPLGDGSYAITSNGKYKAMYTVPKDPKNPLTAELSNVQGRLKYFKEAEALVKAGDIGGAVQMLNALGLKVAGEPLSTEDPDTVRSIVGLEVENLQTGAGKTGGETDDGTIQILSKDGVDVSGQEKQEEGTEPESEPAAEEAPPAPVEQQREGSKDQPGSVFEAYGKLLKPLASALMPNLIDGGSPARQKKLQQIQSMASNVPPARIREQILALQRSQERFARSPEEIQEISRQIQNLQAMLGEGPALASK